MNRVSMTGRLTADPLARQTGGGTAVCALRLAVDKRRGEGAVFVDVESYGESAAAAAQRLSKGDLVGVDGTLAYDEWEKDGVRRHKHYVVGHIEFLRLSGGQEPAAGEDAGPEFEEVEF